MVTWAMASTFNVVQGLADGTFWRVDHTIAQLLLCHCTRLGAAGSIVEASLPSILHTTLNCAYVNHRAQLACLLLHCCPPPLSTAHLLSAIDPATGKPLDNHQLKAEVSIFLLAGFETTSHAITWSLALLVSH
jgi:hypothetical protein